MAVTSSVDAGPMGAAHPSGAGGAEAAAQHAQPEAPGVLAEIGRVAASARDTFSSFLELVTLEAQRAGIALAWMIAASIAAALLAVTGWLALVVALAMWIVALGFPPIGAVLVIALVSAAGAGGLVYWCAAKSRALLFPATRRQVAGESAVKEPAS